MTNTISWSLGSRQEPARLNPNKTSGSVGSFIPLHPSDPCPFSSLSHRHLSCALETATLRHFHSGSSPQSPGPHLPTDPPPNRRQTRDYRGSNRSDRFLNFTAFRNGLGKIPSFSSKPMQLVEITRFSTQSPPLVSWAYPWALAILHYPFWHHSVHPEGFVTAHDKSTQPVEIIRFNTQNTNSKRTPATSLPPEQPKYPSTTRPDPAALSRLKCSAIQPIYRARSADLDYAAKDLQIRQ
jgi:hypothetical protein